MGFVGLHEAILLALIKSFFIEKTNKAKKYNR